MIEKRMSERMCDELVLHRQSTYDLFLFDREGDEVLLWRRYGFVRKATPRQGERLM